MNDSHDNSIDCQKAFERLYDYLDGELNAATTAAIKTHLEICGKCFSAFDFEKTFLLFIDLHAKTRGAPEATRRKVLESLLKEKD